MRTIHAAHGHCGRPREIKPHRPEFEALRAHEENLHDYLDLLKTRGRNKGKRVFTTEEVRQHLGLACSRNEN
jgi:hypothetical protein